MRRDPRMDRCKRTAEHGLGTAKFRDAFRVAVAAVRLHVSVSSGGRPRLRGPRRRG